MKRQLRLLITTALLLTVAPVWHVAGWAQTTGPDAEPAVVPAPPVTVTAPPVAVSAPPVTAPVEFPEPPTAQAYVSAEPAVLTIDRETLVPISFLTNGIGASSGPVGPNVWRVTFFGQTADFTIGQMAARFNNGAVTLDVAPRIVGGVVFVPWQRLSDLFGVTWTIVKSADGATASDKTTFLIQYPAAYIESIRHEVSPDKIHITVQLSAATRIVAAQQGLDVQFHLAAARRPGIADVRPVGDYLVPRIVTRSGDWQADVAVRINYSSPVQWYTVGSPPRLVIDIQRLFEERTINDIGSGLSVSRIRRGMGQGPVQMFLVRVNPAKGWRLRVATAGFGVMQRARTSRIAAQNKALLGINGGFFSYDGAAVGALKVDHEWLRLPWRGRTAIGFKPNGAAHIGNLKATTTAHFSSGWKIPVRDLNGWPDKNQISALNPRFGPSYKLHAGEMAVVVKQNKVVSKPGSGSVKIPAGGFILVASGGAYQWLNKVQRGEHARIEIVAPGWQGFTSVLGGGPRLLQNGKVNVTALQEKFKDDIRVGRGPRTAIGIDSQGNYLILVVDGRQSYYSTGLTLTELAYNLQKYGAVDAINMDGGGSTALAVRDRVINRPSDGRERSVSNALLVMR